MIPTYHKKHFIFAFLNSNNFHMKLEKENLLKNILKLKLFFFIKSKERYNETALIEVALIEVCLYNK